VRSSPTKRSVAEGLVTRGSRESRGAVRGAVSSFSAVIARDVWTPRAGPTRPAPSGGGRRAVLLRSEAAWHRRGRHQRGGARPTPDRILERSWQDVMAPGARSAGRHEVADRGRRRVLRTKSCGDTGLEVADLVVSPIGQYGVGRPPRVDWAIGFEALRRRDGAWRGRGLVVLPLSWRCHGDGAIPNEAVVTRYAVPGQHLHRAWASPRSSWTPNERPWARPHSGCGSASMAYRVARVTTSLTTSIVLATASSLRVGWHSSASAVSPSSRATGKRSAGPSPASRKAFSR
jgi:hypothetical protein